MTEPRKVYGKSRGVEVTDDTIAGMVEEAEAGYDVETLHRRGPRDLNQRAAGIVAEATQSSGIDFTTEWRPRSNLITGSHFEWRPPVDLSSRVSVEIKP